MFKNFYFFWEQSVNSFMINLVLLLFIVLIGGIWPLYERKFLALTQRRVGPKFIGYKGRLQFVADALKILVKEFLTLYKVNTFFFFILPVIYLNLSLVTFLNIYWFSITSFANIEYNLVFIVIVDILLHILLVQIGLTLKNKYTFISISRIINTMFTTELAVLLFFSIYLFILKTFSLSQLFLFKSYITLLPGLLSIVPVLILLFLLETSKTPFDIVEAETEIIMGYHTEYSGFLFGLFILAEYFHTLTSVYIFYILYLQNY